MTVVTITQTTEGNASDTPMRALTTLNKAQVATAKWEEVVNEHETALAEMRRTRDAESLLEREIDALAPIPAELVITRRPDGRPLRTYNSRRIIEEDASLPLERKFALLVLMQKYEMERHEACVRLNWSEADELASSAYHRWLTAFETLRDTPAPNVEALEYKARTVLRYSVMDEEGGELTASNIGEMLLMGGTYTACARLYQDIGRLAGVSPEVTGYEGFDPEAWLDNFESKPGCSFSRGSPSFDHAQAYDPPLMTDRDFLVTDPTIIERYRQHQQAHDPVGYAERLASDPAYGARQFIASEARIDWLFEEGDPRRAEWADRYERFTEQNYALRDGRLLPAHYHLWSDLEQWQKLAVKA